MDVSRNNFYPVPHVDSIVFEIEFKEGINKEEIIRLYKLISQLFLMRRKTMLNNLISLCSSKEKAKVLLNKAGIKENARAESLSKDDYLRLAKIYKEMF